MLPFVFILTFQHVEQGEQQSPYFCEGQVFAWHYETSVHLPQIFLRKIKGSEVSLFEVDDILPFSKYMKTNLGSLTYCMLQPIAHRLQANCARTSQKTAICKVQGLSANGGDKKKIRRRSPDVG